MLVVWFFPALAAERSSSEKTNPATECALLPINLISVALPSVGRRGAYRGPSRGILSSAISCMLNEPAP